MVAARRGLWSAPWRERHLQGLAKTLYSNTTWTTGLAQPRTSRPAPSYGASAADGLHHRLDLLRRGYARVADPDAAAARWVPAFAIDWALEVLGWKNPAPPARLRRCADVIARYAGFSTDASTAVRST